jgi:predicted dehydrogenase
MTPAIPLAIIGAGWVVEKCYLPHLQSGPFVVEAIYDPDGARAHEMYERLPSARVVGSVEEACRRAKAALVASPSPLHMEQCLAALSAGKMVLCEKPVVIRRSHFQQLRQRSAPRAFVVPAAVCRYRSDVRLWLEQCARAGRIRRLALSWVRGQGVPGSPGSWHTRASGGWTGVLPDLGYHLLDLALVTLDRTIAHARVRRLYHRNTDNPAWAAWYAHSGPTQLQVPYDLEADLELDGVPLSIRVSWCSEQAGDVTRLDLEGDHGSVTLNTLFGFSNEPLERVHYCDFTSLGGRTERAEFARGPATHVQAFREVLEGFAVACRSGEDPREQSRLRSVAEIMELLDASEKTRRQAG